ncbi:MAG: dihydrofolate reductase family protein [Candidatus Saccharibacteria bacterium]
MIQTSIIATVSADGFIAREHNELANWSSKADKKLFVELTKRAGVMVMGASTYKTIGRALPDRRSIVYTHGVIDQEGVEVTTELPADLLARLESEGFSEVAICGGATIYDVFLRASLVTDIYLSVSPLLFGAGISLMTGTLDIRLKLKDSKLLDEDTMLLHYEVV